MGKIIKIFIADRHRLFREGLKNAVKNSSIEIVAEADRAEHLIKGLKIYNPDLLITEYRLEFELADDYLPMIKQQFPNLKIVMITMNYSKEALLKYINYLDGFISKTGSGEHIAAAIEVIYEGGYYYNIPNLLKVTGINLVNCIFV